MIKVSSVVSCYEVDGKETSGMNAKRPELNVRSHWNRQEMVVLEIDGKAYTVLASDLKAAVDNATNTSKW
jgi:hypothetical protein